MLSCAAYTLVFLLCSHSVHAVERAISSKVYSDQKSTRRNVAWRRKHTTLIQSNLTAEQQQLSSERFSLSPEREGAAAPTDPSPSDVKVFIGIFTAPVSSGTAPKSIHDYSYRRQLARSLWILRARRYSHVAVKFIVGVNPDPEKHASILEEQQKYGDFLVLPVNDAYDRLSDKTRHFFAEALRQYPNVEWVAKMDDDVYLLPDRLLMAADQWRAAGADYVGCLHSGPTFARMDSRWYEPHALQYGGHYPMRALGPTYVLSRRVVRDVIVRRFGSLRLSGCEDSAVGAWMLGSNARFLADMRLCTVECNPASVAMCDPAAQGLRLFYWEEISKDPGCTTTPAWPMPYVVSYPRPHEKRRRPLQGPIV